MNMQSGLTHWTLDECGNLWSADEREACGPDLVISGYNVEHALQIALFQIEDSRRKLKETEAKLREKERRPMVDGDKKIAAIKALRELTGLGLKDCKNLTEFVLHAAKLETFPDPNLGPAAAEAMANFVKLKNKQAAAWIEGTDEA